MSATQASDGHADGILAGITSPDDLRSLSLRELGLLAEEIRARLIDVTSKNGGHLASSLGAIEIILALHRQFDFSVDRLVFDVGHQAYAHKIITGRNGSFDTLRTFAGICGFPRRDESIYDAHESGHASDSLSIACGLAAARDIRGDRQHVVVLIGDAALSGGMAFEAWNHFGQSQTDMTIILTDNEMSISRNVGALSLYLGKARMSKPYTFTRDTLEGGLRCFGRAGRILVSAGEQAKGSFKKLFVPGMFFEDMGIRYIGPINGHNIGMLAQAIRAASEAPGPVIIHAVTKKGRGFEPAERQPDVFHGVGAYDPDTGEAASSGRGADGKGRTYTQIFAEALVSEAGQNEDIVAITAAMEVGTGLSDFHKRFPGRFFDVGIAEEHAVALAAGLSLGGKLPVVAVYSTFLQRAFDQMMINVALQGQHVVFCLDRAGLVGEDGPTHNGAFDLAYLRSIPGMRIIAPSDSLTFRAALHTALRMEGGPVALRYPRDVAPDDIMSMLPGTLGSLEACAGAACAKSAAPLPPLQAGSVPADACAPASDAAALPVAKARLLTQGRDVAFLALGRLVGVALEAAALLAADGLSSSVYDMLWVKPLDEDAVRQASGSRLVVTLEEGTVKGGFGAAVLEAMAAQRLEDAQAPDQACVLTLGLPDDFVCHGGKEQLFSMLGLTAKDIAMKVTGILGGRAAS